MLREIISTNVYPDLYEIIKNDAEKTGKTMSKLIREILEEKYKINLQKKIIVRLNDFLEKEIFVYGKKSSLKAICKLEEEEAKWWRQELLSWNILFMKDAIWLGAKSKQVNDHFKGSNWIDALLLLPNAKASIWSKKFGIEINLDP